MRIALRRVVQLFLWEFSWQFPNRGPNTWLGRMEAHWRLRICRRRVWNAGSSDGRLRWLRPCVADCSPLRKPAAVIGLRSTNSFRGNRRSTSTASPGYVRRASRNTGDDDGLCSKWIATTCVKSLCNDIEFGHLSLELIFRSIVTLAWGSGEPVGARHERNPILPSRGDVRLVALADLVDVGFMAWNGFSFAGIM